MEIELPKEKKTEKWPFFASYAISVILIIIVFTAFLIPPSSKMALVAPIQNSSDIKLLELNNLMNARLLDVQRFKQSTVNNKSEKNNRESLLRINDSINNSFNNLLDSVKKVGSSYANDNQKKAFNLTISSIGEELQLSDSVLTNNKMVVRDTVVITGNKEPVKSDPLLAMKLRKQLSEAQSNLKDRDYKIRELNSQLVGSLGKSESNLSDQASSQIERENKFLKWALRSQLSDIRKLKDMSNVLRQSNETLNAQLLRLRNKP